MKRWKKVTAGTTLGLLLAATAPVVPETRTATVWWEPYPGAETCFARYKDGEVKELPCTQYWTIASTANYPQPKKTELKSLLSASVTRAAIGYDTSVEDADACVTASSASWSHTSTGSELVMLAGATMQSATDANRDITALTYNGASLISVRRDNNDATDLTSEVWYMAAPDTGSALTVSVTFVDTTTACGYSITLTGVDQSSPLDAQNGTTATDATSISTAVTTVADNAWVIDIVAKQENGFCTGLSAGAGQTERQVSNAAAVDGGLSTEGPQTPAGSVTMSWTFTGANCGLAPADGTISAASFKPAGAVAAATPFDDTYFELLDN